MHTARSIWTRRTCLIALTLIAAACGGGDTDEEMAADTTAMQPDTAAGSMVMTPAQDADQEFLREMTNHHQGLIVMAHEAVEKGGSEVKTLAQTLDQKQDAEQEQMIGILQRDYSDTHQPMVMPKNQAMAVSLSQKSGADYDMAFQMNVVQHHREGIAMIDQYLPRLTRAEVRTMAETMKADQQKDIQEIEAKMGH